MPLSTRAATVLVRPAVMAIKAPMTLNNSRAAGATIGAGKNAAYNLFEANQYRAQMTSRFAKTPMTTMKAGSRLAHFFSM